MYKLTLLGAVDLRGDGGRRISSVLSQPKRMALLALLAIEAPDRLARDEVMARLWPERSDDRARNALRQALHYLGRSLGPDVVTGRGSESIGMSLDKIECDATLLLRAAEEGRHREVLSLYKGELLPAFHFDDAPPTFEHWLDTTRRRLRETAANSAWKVAEAEEAAGDAVGAAAAARQACEVGQWGEGSLQKLLRLLIRTGDTVGARDAYRSFADRLRREHGTQPTAATRAIIEALREEAPKQEESAPPAESPDAGSRDSGSSAPALEQGSRIPRRRSFGRVLRWPATAAAVSLVLLVAWWMEAGAASHDVNSQAESAIWDERPNLYLESVGNLTGSRTWDGMAQAVGNELAAQLLETDGFRVLAAGTASATATGPGVTLRPSLREVAGELQLSVLVVDGVSAAVLDRHVVRADVEASTAPEILAGQMALRIREGVGDLLSWRGLVARGIPPQALEKLRLAAEESRAASGFRRGGALEAAAAAYRDADSLLAQAQSLDPEWIEPTLRRAEMALGAVWLHLIPPNRQPHLAHREILRGLAHAERGVVKAPNDPRALETRGILRHWAALTATDPKVRQEFEAIAEADLLAAVRLDSNGPRAWTVLSAMAERRGDFSAAYYRARRAYATDRDLRAPTDLLVRLFTNALEVGDTKAAAEWCVEAHQRQPEHWLGPYCDLTRVAWVGPWLPSVGDSLLQAGLAYVPDDPTGAGIRTRLELLHAVVLARAGDARGAREALASVDETRAQSPDVLDLTAWVRTVLGETRQARQLLTAAAEVNQGRAGMILNSRRYAELSPYAVVRSDE